MDDGEDLDSRTEKLIQNVTISRRAEERPEYADEEEEEQEEEVPVPEKADEDAEIERIYDPTYRSSLTNETLHQASSREYKSTGNNRNAAVNNNNSRTAKLNQPVQSRGTHDSKNSGKKVPIPSHRFNATDKRENLEGTKYYNFANE